MEALGIKGFRDQAAATTATVIDHGCHCCGSASLSGGSGAPRLGGSDPRSRWKADGSIVLRHQPASSAQLPLAPLISAESIMACLEPNKGALQRLLKAGP